MLAIQNKEKWGTDIEKNMLTMLQNEQCHEKCIHDVVVCNETKCLIHRHNLTKLETICSITINLKQLTKKPKKNNDVDNVYKLNCLV